MDGVASSGKTSILKHLHRKILEQNPSSTKLFISEHYTERILEHLKESGELTGVHIKEHVEKIIGIIADFQGMLDKSKFRNNPKGANLFVTLERFILTHITSLDIENDYTIKEARNHFETIGKMGIKQVLLVIPEARFKEKLMSTIEHRNEAWKEHLYSKGSEKEIVAYYLNWQNNFLKYADIFKDAIDTLIVEVKDNNYAEYSDIIFNYCFNIIPNKTA